MSKKRILFISGSCGLGHVTRDVVIADALRDLQSNIDITWLAGSPAKEVLEERDERIHPKVALFTSVSCPAENAAKPGYKLNLLDYLMKAREDWKKNVQVFVEIINNEPYDMVVGDETYELSVAFKKNLIQTDVPYVVFYDCYGNVATSWHLKERLGTYLWNRIWTKNPAFWDGKKHFILFLGEPEDIPNDRLGFLMPNRREFAKQVCHFVGNVVPFDPADYKDKQAIRQKLGYGKAPLVICSIGGTSVGRDLLILCGQAYPLMKERIPDLKMVIVGGPRLAPDTLNLPDEIEIREYVPALYEHFAACDLVIVHGGFTSTLELAALQKPFIYFPLEGHFEQQVHVNHRLVRHRAGVKMAYSQTSPELLATGVLEHIGKAVNYGDIPLDGAQKAAQFMVKLLS